MAATKMKEQKISKGCVIGCGEMGKNHIRILSNFSGVKFIGAVDKDEKKTQKMRELYKINTFSSINEMLKIDKPDFAVVAVPTEFHKSVALELINNKINILIEKPIAFDEEQAEEIITAANKAIVKLMIGHIERFNPAVMELKRRLDLGELGEVYKIDVQRIGPYPNRIADVGVIIDLSVHDLDIIRYLIGREPISIFSKTQQILHKTAEDSVVGLIRYPKNILATLNINFLSPTKIRQLTIFGKKGMFRVDYLRQELYFCKNPSYDEKAEKEGIMWAVSEGNIRSIEIAKKEPLLSELESFVSCVKDDNTNCKIPVTGQDGLLALRYANMLKASSVEKRTIEVM